MGTLYIQGAPIKNNPLEKILGIVADFFHQIYAVYRGGFRPCIQQIAFKYLVWLQNYSYLNLKGHFSK